MTTKEQERKALAKIREIAETLDNDGWVMMAFKGVFELAEQNINDDFACSFEDIVEHERREKEESQKAYAKASETVKELQDENAELTGQLSDEKEQRILDEKRLAEYATQIRDLQYENSNLVIAQKELSDEIVRLKAKLYDLLYARAS